MRGAWWEGVSPAGQSRAQGVKARDQGRRRRLSPELAGGRAGVEHAGGALGLLALGAADQGVCLGVHRGVGGEAVAVEGVVLLVEEERVEVGPLDVARGCVVDGVPSHARWKRGGSLDGRVERVHPGVERHLLRVRPRKRAQPLQKERQHNREGIG